jgi:hypothetical protein
MCLCMRMYSLCACMQYEYIKKEIIIIIKFFLFKIKKMVAWTNKKN